MQVIAATVIYIAGNTHIILHGFVGCADQHLVTVLQVYLLCPAHHLAQVILQIFPLAVLLAFYLDKIRINIEFQTAGPVYQVLQCLTLHHFILHGTVYSSLYSNYLLCHRYKQHVTVLQVILELGVRILHVGIEVYTAVLSGTAHLYVTD